MKTQGKTVRQERLNQETNHQSLVDILSTISVNIFCRTQSSVPWSFRQAKLSESGKSHQACYTIKTVQIQITTE